MLRARREGRGRKDESQGRRKRRSTPPGNSTAIPLSIRTSMANGDMFTRRTWRAGKNRRMRKRMKPWGGQISANAAFFRQPKQRLQTRPPGVPHLHRHQKAGNPCGMLALKGSRSAESMAATPSSPCKNSCSPRAEPPPITSPAPKQSKTGPRQSQTNSPTSPSISKLTSGPE